MNKKAALFIVIIVIVLAALAGVFSLMISSTPQIVEQGGKSEPDVEDAPQPSPQPAALKTERIVGEYYTIDLQYPEHSERERPEIGTYVERVKSNFLAIPNSPSLSQEPYSLKMNARAYTSSTTVSYRLETYMYTGGAHGGTAVAAFTYDVDGHHLDLYDVLPSKAALVDASTAARKYFTQKLGDQLQKEVLDKGTAPDKINFNTWYLTDDGITFVFQQYQIGAYVLGIQEFTY